MSTSTCRKCHAAFHGKGRYRTGEGSLCPSCVSSMSNTQRQREDIAAREHELRIQKTALSHLEEKARADAQKAIGKILFPLHGPARQKSIEALDMITAHVATKPDTAERYAEVVTMITKYADEVEKAILDAGEEKKKATRDKTAKEVRRQIITHVANGSTPMMIDDFDDFDIEEERA